MAQGLELGLVQVQVQDPVPVLGQVLHLHPIQTRVLGQMQALKQAHMRDLMLGLEQGQGQVVTRDAKVVQGQVLGTVKDMVRDLAGEMVQAMVKAMARDMAMERDMAVAGTTKIQHAALRLRMLGYSVEDI